MVPLHCAAKWQLLKFDTYVWYLRLFFSKAVEMPFQYRFIDPTPCSKLPNEIENATCSFVVVVNQFVSAGATPISHRLRWLRPPSLTCHIASNTTGATGANNNDAANSADAALGAKSKLRTWPCARASIRRRLTCAG